MSANIPANVNARAMVLVDPTTGAALANPGSLPAEVPITAVGAAGAGVTLTIPAPPAGKFNYLTFLEIVAYATAAVAGAATPITVTTTGLPNNPAFTLATAMPIGTTQKQGLGAGGPQKAAAAASTITVVCPATASVIWRVNATYYQA